MPLSKPILKTGSRKLTATFIHKIIINKSAANYENPTVVG